MTQTQADREHLLRMAAEIDQGVALAESSMPDVGVPDVKRQALASARQDAAFLRRLAEASAGPPPVDAPNTYQQRVLAEYRDVEGKLSRLLAFLATKPVDLGRIDTAEQNRLRTQASIMQAYLDVLAARVAAWPEEE